jgi:hypothetical protein
MQDIWASLVGRLVKDSNTDFRKAIRSINQGEAVPLQHNEVFPARKSKSSVEWAIIPLTTAL